LYLASRAWGAKKAPKTLESSSASRDRREAFSKYAYDLAIAAGMQTQRAERVVQVARRVALKSEVDSKELGLLVSLLRKAEIAAKKTSV
jgi:tRNA C32,U32 (ribose-2'-O)-methylase TrmJ